jgi:nucleoside-diphosphate-sugar epimerase
MNLLKRAAETGETLEMSPGEQLIDLVHVDDVVEAFCTAQELITIQDH